MTLDRQRPEILTPPGHPPACCSQQTITVPPQVTAKTAQKHDYPSAAHRRSYARRTGAERTFSTAKDPASNNITRGWCRLTGLVPLTLWLASLLAIRNQRILTAWTTRQHNNTRRAAAGPATPDPPPAPQDPHRPGHRRHPALTPAGNPHTLTRPPEPRPSRPCPQTPRQARRSPKPANDGQPHKTSDPNVKIGTRSNVKTTPWGGWDSNPGPADYESAALTG